jgi:hypothetical protein
MTATAQQHKQIYIKTCHKENTLAGYNSNKYKDKCCRMLLMRSDVVVGKRVIRQFGEK